MSSSYLIVVGGATASGKTSAAIALAQHFQTAVISCDSRQFYREMTIGTAKPTLEEQAAVPHYFIDNLSIQDTYSVGHFERETITLLDRLFETTQVVVLAGGTGLYIRAVCEGLDEFPKVPTTIRTELEFLLEKEGIEALQKELEARDPIYYQEVDQHNHHRLIRALGVIRASGQAFSAFRQKKKASRKFTPIYINLELERALLYERINQRVDLMLEAGLLEEARELYPSKHLNALQTVGYQEFFDYFDAKISLKEATELVKRNSRRYAKRQMTWFRKEAHWKGFHPTATKEMVQYIKECIGVK